MSRKKLPEPSGASLTRIAAIESGRTGRPRRPAGGERDPAHAAADPLQPRPVTRWRMPVYGSRGGDAGTMVLTPDPVAFLECPDPFIRARDAYGVIVHGEGMAPACRPGESALIHPHAAPHLGGACLFLKNDGTRTADLAEFRGEITGCWRVGRLRPSTHTYSLQQAEWPTCHVVVGKHIRP